jgi:hypothetical protein|tara:strand:- start:1925 stop:2089 length:165 start_codon:yes stop_codon:yes gene_type:complete
MSASTLIIKELEKILDDLCKITDRDIFIVYPSTNGEIMLYLIDEIKKTTKLLNK